VRTEEAAHTSGDVLARRGVGAIIKTRNNTKARPAGQQSQGFVLIVGPERGTAEQLGRDATGGGGLTTLMTGAR
jgi:hypothetical protein